MHGAEGGEGLRVALEVPVITPRVQAIRRTLPPDTDPDRERAYEHAVTALRELGGLPPDEAIAAGRLLARLLHQLGRLDEAAAAADGALSLAMEQGRLATAVELGLLLVPQLQDRGDERGARYALDAVRSGLPAVLDAEPAVLWSYYEGHQAQSEQDLGASLLHYQRAERAARRLGLLDLELGSATQRVMVLGLLGRDAEQQATVERILALMEPLPQLSCKHANYLNGVGWSMLMAVRADEPSDAARHLLERAERIFAPGGGCEVGHQPVWLHALASLRLNLALEALHRGDPDACEAQLDALAGDSLPTVLHPWVGYVQARLAQARDDPEAALHHVEQLDADPELGADPLLPWQVAVLRGDLERAHGSPERALEAYLRAEQRLDELVRTVGIDQGREGLLAGVHTSAAQAIDLLLRRGEPERAAALARASRARALRPMGRAAELARLPPAAREIWQRELGRYRALARRLESELVDAWSLPEDERERLLREHARERDQMRQHLDEAYRALSTTAPEAPTTFEAPGPGQAWLLTHPLPEGWVAFLLTSTEVLARRIPALPPPDDPTALAAALLEPFAEALADARALQILPMGPLVERPLHALPWRDDVLLATIPVVYKLDLGSTPTTVSADAHAALVVADPATRREGLGWLPAAREEGEQVAATLRAHGWSVTALVGDAATHAAVTEGLGRVELLHYAGHGEHAGVEGWDSVLPLAAETSLDVRDVLALPHAPRSVVLSGCETGLSDGQLGAGGMHLAGAFLVAGSSHVVAAAQEVPDELSSALGRALYDNDVLELPPAARLQRALLRLRARPEPWSSQWAIYRGFVP